MENFETRSIYPATTIYKFVLKENLQGKNSENNSEKPKNTWRS